MLWAGLQWLEAHVNVVNGLNVFPVPDGDTGTNMVLTIRSALAEVGRTSGSEVGTVTAAAAQGALMGARGNSGVILSQFLEGVAAGLRERVFFTAGDFARACQVGFEQAYQSVVRPVEGTILTVIRQVAQAAQESAGNSPDLVALFEHVVKMARVAQAGTPELLPVLKEAGVTDAGGQGLLYILEGALRFLKGEVVDRDPAGEKVPILQSTLGAETERYGYDVQFLIQGDGLEVDKIRTQIDSLGWSTVVSGDTNTVKVHIHAFDPDLPIRYGASQGRLSDVVIENMEEQARKFVREAGARRNLGLPDPGGATNWSGESLTDTAIICTAPGPGLVRLFYSLGASEVIFGGAGANPSTEELLGAISRARASHVLLLPNNGNVMMAAQKAQALALKNVQIVATRTIPQGIAALLAFNYQADFETNARWMEAEARNVQTIEVVQATRATRFNGLMVQSGDIIGLLDDVLLSVGQNYHEVALDVLVKGQVGPAEIATIYYGQDVPEDQARVLAEKMGRFLPELKIEVLAGGQPHYPYIISLE